ncbi:MAG: DUF2314 domain-containing protein [Myxococcaceae bacterium]|nr:DUF2314 domain-containing protein [Myxococcaceae bacterium]
MKEVYIVATESPKPVTEDAIREAFESDEIELTVGEDGCLFSVSAESTRIDVRFESRKEDLGWSPDLLSGTPPSHEALQGSRGFYRFSFEPGKPHSTVAVFEALWCVRTLLEIVEGVVIDITAFKLHTQEDVEELTELEFDIRDHISLHAVEASQTDAPLWIHSHGMAKFGIWDVEVFNLGEADLKAAEIFFHELCTDLAFGQAPPPRTPVATSVGAAFMLLPAEEARPSLRTVTPETFAGHEMQFLTVVSPEGRHNLTELLSHYRDRFEAETDEEAQERADEAKELLPAFKQRFQRKGLMEPLAFLVRVPFEVHPDAEGKPDEERLWVEVITWEEDVVIGKLVDGGQSTTEWRKGAHVEVEESQINAIGVAREGRQLDPDEMKTLLLAEKLM